MLGNNEIADMSLKYRKKAYKANKTIVTLCNYILKSTDDKKAIKRATTELRKANKAIEHEESIDKLIKKITDINCQRIAADETAPQEVKDINIIGLQQVHKEYSVK